MTPDEWLADFEAKTAELQRNAASFRRNLESAGTTVTTEDKSVTVMVAPNGALLDLKIEGDTELDTDVTVPGPVAPEQQPAARPEDEDFSEKSLYRKESW